MQKPAGERGAGSLLVVGILAATIALAALCAPLYSVLVAKQQVAGAADAAALAAADVAVGRVPGVPCTVADAVSAANRATLLGCEEDGVIVTVRVGTTVLGFQIVATATAGPPGSAG
jgi:secretion/DNA translocation related TadE-like protein